MDIISYQHSDSTTEASSEQQQHKPLEQLFPAHSSNQQLLQHNNTH